MKHLPLLFLSLTYSDESRRGTVYGCQFAWGRHLQKSNAGIQRSTWSGRKSGYKCKSISWLDCETYKSKSEISDIPIIYLVWNQGRKTVLVILATYLVWARAYWIKATLGITGQSRPIVHIDDVVRHLDVDLAHPGPEEGAKGWSVRPLKRYVSWVQSVARQLGLYPW